MPDAYLLLEEHFQKLARLDHALTFLQWDHMVMMPPGGSEATGQGHRRADRITP